MVFSLVREYTCFDLRPLEQVSQLMTAMIARSFAADVSALIWLVPVTAGQQVLESFRQLLHCLMLS
jgi:hypothetical protein